MNPGGSTISKLQSIVQAVNTGGKIPKFLFYHKTIRLSQNLAVCKCLRIKILHFFVARCLLNKSAQGSLSNGFSSSLNKFDLGGANSLGLEGKNEQGEGRACRISTVRYARFSAPLITRRMLAKFSVSVPFDAGPGPVKS